MNADIAEFAGKWLILFGKPLARETGREQSGEGRPSDIGLRGARGRRITAQKAIAAEIKITLGLCARHLRGNSFQPGSGNCKKTLRIGRSRDPCTRQRHEEGHVRQQSAVIGALLRFLFGLPAFTFEGSVRVRTILRIMRRALGRLPGRRARGGFCALVWQPLGHGLVLLRRGVVPEYPREGGTFIGLLCPRGV